MHTSVWKIWFCVNSINQVSAILFCFIISMFLLWYLHNISKNFLICTQHFFWDNSLFVQGLFQYYLIHFQDIFYQCIVLWGWCNASAVIHLKLFKGIHLRQAGSAFKDDVIFEQSLKNVHPYFLTRVLFAGWLVTFVLLRLATENLGRIRFEFRRLICKWYWDFPNSKRIEKAQYILQILIYDDWYHKLLLILCTKERRMN